MLIYLFIYLGFYVAFNTVQVISRRVVGRAEETSTFSLSGFCTVNCRPMASNYQLSHLRPCRESNPGLRGGRRECCHSATVAPGAVLRGVYHDMAPSSTCTEFLILNLQNPRYCDPKRKKRVKTNCLVEACVLQVLFQF